MKRGLILLSIFLLIAMAIYAGGGAQSTSQGTPVLRGFAFVNARLVSSVSNFNEIWAFQEAERATGVRVNWIHPPVGQDTEQANLMIASGDLPDFMYMNYNNLGGLPKLLADETIITLNQYYDEGKIPGYRAIMERYPDVRRQLLMDDGTLAGFFMLRIRDFQGQLGWFSNGGIVIRKDWLDSLNLAAPTTVAEFEQMLRIFKERMPAITGRSDIIPLATSGTEWGGWAQFWGLADDFFDLNGTAKYGPMEPAYRNFIETFARWHRDGLIEPDWTNIDQRAFQARFLENRAGAALTNAGTSGTLLDIMRDTIPNADFLGIQNLKNAADGRVYSTLLDLRQSFVNEASMITSDNRNIDATLKYLDWGYTTAGFEAFNWGQPGVSYTVRADGAKFFTDIVTNHPDGFPFDRALGLFSMAMNQWSIPKDPEYWPQATLRFHYQHVAIDEWGKVDNAIAMPPISRTAEEARRFSQIMNDVTTLKNETITRIILGVEPISALDTMASRLRSMGIDEAIQIQQAALSRYYARR